MADALALFVTAFAAATILPFSSEAALVGALLSGMDHRTALGMASLGNVLAVMLNYALGYWLYEKMHMKLQTSSIGTTALSWGHRFGYVMLPLSVLPVIGDPLTVVAGVMRLNFFWFLAIVASLRIGRYYLIVLAF